MEKERDNVQCTEDRQKGEFSHWFIDLPPSFSDN